MNGTVPTEGVDGQGDHGCMLTMNDVGLDATPIQHVESAPGLVGSVRISFGSLDFGFARIERGDGLKVRFPPSTHGRRRRVNQWRRGHAVPRGRRADDRGFRPR